MAVSQGWSKGGGGWFDAKGNILHNTAMLGAHV